MTSEKKSSMVIVYIRERGKKRLLHKSKGIRNKKEKCNGENGEKTTIAVKKTKERTR
jgi:hypothetical protein